MKLLHVFSILLLTFLGACGSAGKVDDPMVSVPQIKIELPPSGVVEIGATGSGMVKFTTNTKWLVAMTDTKASEWLAVSPMSGDPGTVELSLTARPNNDAQSRKSLVTITAGTTVQKFEVLQPAAKGSIGIDKNSFTAGAEQTVLEVNVLTNNAGWQAATDANWITVAPKNGKGSAKVTVNLTGNKDKKVRWADVVFSVEEEKQTLRITQMGSEPLVLEIDRKSADLEAQAGDFAVNIVTNGASWEVESASEWLLVSPKQGNDNAQVKVAYTENPMLQPRTGTVKFVSGELSQTLTVMQKEGFEDIDLNPSSKKVTADAGRFTMDVLVRGTQWQATGCPDWVTLSEYYYKDSKTITVMYTANTVAKERSCEILFRTGQVAKTLNIMQEAASAMLTLDVTSKSVGNGSGSFDVTLTTNEAEWVSSHPGYWVTVSPDKGTGTARITIAYEANKNGQERRETITFKAGRESGTLVVNQAPADSPQTYIELDINSKDVVYTGGAFDVLLKTNARQWVAEHVPSWLSVSPAAGDAGQKVRITCEENTRTQPRFATIKFNAGNVAAYITVTQAAAPVPVKEMKGVWEGKFFYEGGINYSVDIKDNYAATLRLSNEEVSITLDGTWSQNGNQVILNHPFAWGSLKLTGTVDTSYQKITGNLLITEDGESIKLPLTLYRVKNDTAVMHIDSGNKTWKHLFNK